MKTLIIGTSAKTRGGITSVIKSHQKISFWKKWNCVWLETHIDKSFFHKIFYFIRACSVFLLNIFTFKIIHVHLSGPSSTKRKLFFINISSFLNRKVIIHFHAFSSESKIDLDYKTLYLKTFNKADKIIVLSNSWKMSLIDDLKIPKNKIDVVYNPCQTIKKQNLSKKEKIILYAGTLNDRKNFKSLIKAFALIAVDFPDWKLVFAGNGQIEEGKKLVSSLNIESQVNFIGWISGEQKDFIFSVSSIFCLPSYAEGFPMAILDAWSYALPVITTPVGGIPDVAIDGENILLFSK